MFSLVGMCAYWMLDVDLRRKKSNIARESGPNEIGYVSLRRGLIDNFIKFEQREEDKLITLH